MPALLIAALLLRAVPWLANLPLHHDEALYGAWARTIADGTDPFLLIPWVDKPPLVLYLLALSVRLFGAAELALRVPGMIASVLTVGATFGLARRVAGQRAAVVAALLMAAAPFAILFAPTAFTDGWLTLFIVAAAWAALAGRPGLAGVLLGLACASKQQGVFGAPLVVALVVIAGRRPDRYSRPVRSILAAMGLALLGFAVVFGAVTWWDSLRWHNRPSYWDQSLRTYGGVVLAPLADWPRRAVAWAEQAGYWFGAWPVTALMLVLGLAGLRPDRSGRPVRSRVLISLYLLAYLLVHITFTFQPWDRYLLPCLPLVCVMCGQGLVRLYDSVHAHGRVRRFLAVVTAATLIYAATLGLTAAIPVGSDIGVYHGVAEAARFLAAQPAGTTVYYDRIGWHLAYYLYGRPITRSWYDSPEKLARETARVANEQPSAAQWLVLPAWEAEQLPELAQALAVNGFSAMPEYEVIGRGGKAELTLYRLEPHTLEERTTMSQSAFSRLRVSACELHSQAARHSQAAGHSQVARRAVL